MVINKAMEPNANHVVNSVNLNNNSENKNANRDFNPSVLGREFVRQYYTMLNEGPQNLFRFYSDNSSLIHGNEPGESVTPAYGQYDINKKLMSLNFKDCHTKTRQVDSLETVNKSVVIQVIGELSNNGQPMRRFFQTFILTPRSPTHYYVRNDIFRYQDEVFVDDDEGYTEENLDDVGSNHVIDTNATIDPSDANQANMLSSSLNVNNAVNLQASQQKNNGQLGGQEKSSEFDLNQERSTKFSCMNPEISPINTVASNAIDLQQLNNSGSEQSIDSSLTNDNNDKQATTLDDDDEDKEEQEKHDTDPQSTDEASSSVLVQSPPHQPQSTTTHKERPAQEPRTYATMVQRKFGQLNAGGSSSVIVNSLDKKDGQLIKSNEESLVNTVLNNVKKEKDDYVSSEWNIESNNSEPAATFAITANTTSTSTSSNHHDSKPQRNGGGGQMADEQQVFVGNLPSDIDEDKLKEYFKGYGQLIDVRICQKQGKTPNYGFITFNEALVVKKILSEKPIFFDGLRINVEEKKSGRNFNSSSSGSFTRKDKDHLSNRNFNSSTGSSSQFSAFSNSSRVKEDRNRAFKDKERKSSNANSNSNSNFRR